MLLGSILSWLGLLVGCSFTSPWVIPNSLFGLSYRSADDYLSLDGPVEVAGAVEVNTLDLPPVVSADAVAW